MPQQRSINFGGGAKDGKSTLLRPFLFDAARNGAVVAVMSEEAEDDWSGYIQAEPDWQEWGGRFHVWPDLMNYGNSIEGQISNVSSASLCRSRPSWL